MSRPQRPAGIGVVELMSGVGLMLVVLGMAYALFRFSVVSVGSTLSPQVGLQMAARRALVDFVREIQESIEVVRPPSGATLTYLLVRDKLNQILMSYQVKNDADSAMAGRNLYDVYIQRAVPGATGQSQLKVLSNVQRLAFTTLAPGVVQINLDVYEQGKSYTLLTAVRLRNVLTEGEF